MKTVTTAVGLLCLSAAVHFADASAMTNPGAAWASGGNPVPAVAKCTGSKSTETCTSVLGMNCTTQYDKFILSGNTRTPDVTTEACTGITECRTADFAPPLLGCTQ